MADKTAARPLRPFTADHFRKYASLLVYDDGETRSPEDWQLAFIEDLFEGRPENWLITPEGNGKTTFTAIVCVYGADFSPAPWIPVGAASSKQARILHNQAGAFIERTPGLAKRFRVYGGYLRIESLANGPSPGIEIFAADPKTGDGVIPYPYAIIDEGHRQEDMRLYRLWKGKLRKRGAQILMLSTAGEPETPFENTRESIRRTTGDRKRKDAFLRVQTPRLVMHEFMVVSDEACADMAQVKDANPLSTITEQTLREDFESATFDLGDWKRLKCNRATRSVQTAITDAEWDAAEVDHWVEGEDVDVGMDVAFKWDTTALVPLWKGSAYRLLGPAEILIPPRDGTSLHPDEIKLAFERIAERNTVRTLIMDIHRAEDLASWFQDQGITVFERGTTNQPAVQDYEAVMDGLRNGTLKHSGHAGLRAHVLNAIARRLPGGDRRFDRPSAVRQNANAQDRRVIDALTATGMVTYFSTTAKPRESAYNDRALLTV